MIPSQSVKKSFFGDYDTLVTPSSPGKQLSRLQSDVSFSYHRLLERWVADFARSSLFYQHSSSTDRREESPSLELHLQFRLPVALERAIGLYVYLAVLAACSPPHEQSTTSVTIVPASRTVALETTTRGRAINVSIVITNTSSNSILWSDCALALEEYRYLLVPDRKGSDWTEVWSPGCPDLSVTTPPLRPGESVTVPLRIVAARDSSFDFVGRRGVYRIHFFLSAVVAGEYAQLPYAESVSQSFNVVDE